MKTFIKKFLSIVRRVFKLLLLIVLLIILIDVIAEYVIMYKVEHLSEINMTGLVQEEYPMQIHVKKSSAARTRSALTVPFGAEEGPFFFEVNDEFTDFKIWGCRVCNLIVFQPCYEVVSEDEKAKLLPVIKRAYERRKRDAQETYENVYGKKEEQTIDVSDDKEVATP